MSDNNSAVKAGGGIGFAGLLTVAFVVLKLCKVITWSWWWVFSPLWISWIVAIILVIILIFLGAWSSKW